MANKFLVEVDSFELAQIAGSIVAWSHELRRAGNTEASKALLYWAERAWKLLADQGSN